MHIRIYYSTNCHGGLIWSGMIHTNSSLLLQEQHAFFILTQPVLWHEFYTQEECWWKALKRHLCLSTLWQPTFHFAMSLLHPKRVSSILDPLGSFFGWCAPCHLFWYCLHGNVPILGVAWCTMACPVSLVSSRQYNLFYYCLQPLFTEEFTQCN